MQRALGTHNFSTGRYHTDIVVRDNTITSNANDAIHIMNWTNPVFTGNTITSRGGSAGIRACGTSNPTITANTFAESGTAVVFRSCSGENGTTRANAVTADNVTALRANLVGPGLGSASVSVPDHGTVWFNGHEPPPTVPSAPVRRHDRPRRRAGHRALVPRVRRSAGTDHRVPGPAVHRPRFPDPDRRRARRPPRDGAHRVDQRHLLLGDRGRGEQRRGELRRLCPVVHADRPTDRPHPADRGQHHPRDSDPDLGGTEQHRWATDHRVPDLRLHRPGGHHCPTRRARSLSDRPPPTPGPGSPGGPPRTSGSPRSTTSARARPRTSWRWW